MKIVAKEFIMHPRPAEIRELAGPQVLPYLTALWNRNLTDTRVDFDRLYGSGQLARQLNTPGVEGSLRSWLTQTTAPTRWDIGSSFLMGYWASLAKPDEGLVALLHDALKASPPTRNVDTLVMAIGAAAETLESKPLRKDVLQTFRQLQTTSRATPLQPSTLETIGYVLKNVVSAWEKQR